MNIQNLEKAIRATEEKPEGNFDLGVWKDDEDRGCVLFHYIRRHPESNLILKPKNSEGGVYHVPVSIKTGAEEWDAITEHFDCTREQALHLFADLDRKDKSRTAALNRIRGFIAKEKSGYAS